MGGLSLTPETRVGYRVEQRNHGIDHGKSWLPFVQLRGKHDRLPKREKCRLSYKSSSKFFSSAKRELEIFIVLGGKANERAGALRALAYYRNRKREAKDFEKV